MHVKDLSLSLYLTYNVIN